MHDIYGMVWYTQVELVLVISVLTRKFRSLNNKIDLAVFSRGWREWIEEWEIWTKNSPLLREALGPLGWVFSDNNYKYNSFYNYLFLSFNILSFMSPCQVLAMPTLNFEAFCLLMDCIIYPSTMVCEKLPKIVKAKIRTIFPECFRLLKAKVGRQTRFANSHSTSDAALFLHMHNRPVGWMLSRNLRFSFRCRDDGTYGVPDYETWPECDVKTTTAKPRKIKRNYTFTFDIL